MKYLLCSFFSLFLVSCADFHLGMKYQKTMLSGTEIHPLYCYKLVWGLDAESMVISDKSDVCEGIDSTKDICFGRGHVEIYYKVKSDTLEIYSMVRPKYPADFKYPIIYKNMEHDEYRNFEEAVKEGELNKVSFGYHMDETPCKVSPALTREAYKRLLKIAPDSVWVRLAKSNTPVVGLYAFEALLSKKSPEFEAVRTLLKTDTAVVTEISDYTSMTLPILQFVKCFSH